MTHVVAISPHLDDAAFSVGGVLAAHARAGDRVTIVTCFTGNVAAPTGFALACQLDKGVDAEVDYMALRRAEDRAACSVIGAQAVHLPLLEAPHRGYGSAHALFGPRRNDDTMPATLTGALAAQVDTLAPDVLLGPLAIGDHVDHWLVRDALAAIGRPLLLWEDWPYLTRASDLPSAPATRTHRLDDEDRAARLAMCAAYTSQIGFQFGSLHALADAVAAVTAERLHAA
ncbi:LmbE family N-acetylglucosaminyl deacetylase [Sphingomonas sp. BE138]|uniref:PIG-L deacetylase family protein n=1 Tax=Sphingomonas sp. BE138 TaxID=2817845 RepID=UPI00285AA15F|nr:PIG-L family deacetylase [Sphingomonas sp. BE138]MDR6787708.1 LmbE family N-acetylglucosaminyl deacetylase [Sphingomonas sp. BE138]